MNSENNVIDITGIKRDADIVEFDINDPASIAMAKKIAPQNYAAFLELKERSHMDIHKDHMKNYDFSKLRINKNSLY